MGLRAVCSSGDSDGQAAFLVLSRVWRAFFQKAHLKWELAMQATEGGCFFRCTLVFALVQAFYSFLRLVFLNDYLLFFPLSLVPPAAKEGKGDCEFPLCPPWILLLPLCNAGHCVPRGGYGGGLLSIELSISGGRFYDIWLIWERCSLAQTMLLLWRGADARYLIVNVG